MPSGYSNCYEYILCADRMETVIVNPEIYLGNCSYVVLIKENWTQCHV